jgi:response regulator NasT
MPGLDGIDAVLAFSREKEVPAILVSGYHDAELLRRASAEPIMAYLVKPISQADVETAIAVSLARFEQFSAARREARELRQALEDRKVVERAKGVVMNRLHLSEPEAFRRLKKLANDQNRKLIEMARIILAAEEVFRDLDSEG